MMFLAIVTTNLGMLKPMCSKKSPSSAEMMAFRSTAGMSS